MWMRFFLLWGSSLLGLNLNAQTEQLPATVDRNQNVVVATTGLSLRQAPSLNAKRLVVVPYGQTVEVLSERSYGQHHLKDDYFYYQDGEGGEMIDTVPVMGQWVKVRYRGQAGYVSNSYLIRSGARPHNEVADVNQQVVLLRPGDNCVANLGYRPGWSWYGIYQTDDGWEQRPVTVSLYKSWREMGELCISTNDNRRLWYLIGSAQPLQLPKTLYNRTEDGREEFWRVTPGAERIDRAFNHRMRLFYKPIGRVKLLLQPSKERPLQRLNPSHLSLGAPTTLVWCGDLDGDGQDDYLVRYGEGSSQVVLYLSSYAKGEEQVHPVAIWYQGWCC